VIIDKGHGMLILSPELFLSWKHDKYSECWLGITAEWGDIHSWQVLQQLQASLQY